jgi:hypothetical protein
MLRLKHLCRTPCDVDLPPEHAPMNILTPRSAGPRRICGPLRGLFSLALQSAMLCATCMALIFVKRLPVYFGRIGE